MRVLKLDMGGLDLVLGGGVRLLERVKGCGESTTLLIRGPAGSGKTVLGTQLAASVARELGTDVAYGCVELLPTELRAQHESVRGEKSDREQVVVLGEEEGEEPNARVRIYAGLLDLGEGGETVERLGGALDTLLKSASRKAGRPARVLVIDSLSEGYGLGAGAPRVLADGIAKLAAERGLVVVLLEEQADERTSVWGFAVDTVFELKPAEEGTPFERRLLVPKNRLGPSDPGPHEFDIRHGVGATVHPREVAYRKPWARDLQSQWTPQQKPGEEQPWRLHGLGRLEWLPPFRESITAVVSDSLSFARMAARDIGRPLTQEHRSVALHILLGAVGSPRASPTQQSEVEEHIIFGPLQSGPFLLHSVRARIEAQRLAGQTPSRVLIGDLHDLRNHADPSRVLLTISTIASLLRDLQIPLILYETLDSFHASAAATSIARILIKLSSTDLPPYMKTQIQDLWNPHHRSEFESMSPPL